MEPQESPIDFRCREPADNMGWVFNIQRYSIQDGPGIRTTVFLQGCPLKCLWCDNPESQSARPQLFYFDSQCTKCYRCIEICPNKANTIKSDGSIQIDRSSCVVCGKCVEACSSEARIVSGKRMSADEALEEVSSDALFYRNSGGGMTLSGGESLYQPEFAVELLKGAQMMGIHTALDTSGFASWSVLEEALRYTDLVLYDIKHMDNVKHMVLTGVENRLILENAENIGRMGKEIIIRVPLIPAVNDSEENINALGRFAAGIGLQRIDLLPYHQLGLRKYHYLGKICELSSLRLFRHEDAEMAKHLLERYGLQVDII